MNRSLLSLFVLMWKYPGASRHATWKIFRGELRRLRPSPWIVFMIGLQIVLLVRQ